MKFVYKLKRGPSGEIVRYKARWVVRGFQQEKRLDCQETFASVVKLMIYKAIFAIAAALNLELHQMDVIQCSRNRGYRLVTHHFDECKVVLIVIGPNPLLVRNHVQIGVGPVTYFHDQPFQAPLMPPSHSSVPDSSPYTPSSRFHRFPGLGTRVQVLLPLKVLNSGPRLKSYTHLAPRSLQFPHRGTSVQVLLAFSELNSIFMAPNQRCQRALSFCACL